MQSAFSDATYGSGSEFFVPAINFGAGGNGDPNFVLRFYHYSDPNLVNIIKIDSIGRCGPIRRKVTVNMNIQPSAEVLKYAIASKTRIWITGDSTIHGNIYSSWKYQNISPFNITSDSKVEGVIGTIVTNTDPGTGQKGPDVYADGSLMPYDLETLTADGNPMYNVTGEGVYDGSGNPVANVVGYSSPAFDADGNRIYDADGRLVYDVTDVVDLAGNPVYDSDGHPIYAVQGNKVISYSDEIQGPCDSIDYDVYYGEKASNMPGMKITDYNTSTYRSQTTALSTTSIPTVTEYFPHDVGDYAHGPSSSVRVTRYKYENQTFTNKRVSAWSYTSGSPGTMKGTLFKNCTFEGILYIDCTQNADTFGNVRFENCVFNGPIVTNTPTYPSHSSGNWWKKNCLYFTGEETFQTPEEYRTTILRLIST